MIMLGAFLVIPSWQTRLAALIRMRSRLISAGRFGKGLLGAAFIVIGAAIVSGAD
jgi:hypothetical protein